MEDEEEVDYKQELIERSKSKERMRPNPKTGVPEPARGVFEGYLLKVIDTSNLIRGLKH